MANRLNRFRKQIDRTDDFWENIVKSANKKVILGTAVGLSGFAGFATEHPLPIIAGTLFVCGRLHLRALQEREEGYEKFLADRTHAFKRLASETSPSQRNNNEPRYPYCHL